MDVVTVSASSRSVAARARSWYLLHVLALLAFLFVAFLFSLAVYSSVTDRVPKFEMPLPVRLLGSLSFIAVFWLWIRMLIDFFRRRPPSHPVAWGFFLFLGSYVGALVYFWVVWRPRNRPDTA